MSAAGRTRILGIDPGTLRLGYGVIDRVGTSKLAYVECRCDLRAVQATAQPALLTIGCGLRETARRTWSGRGGHGAGVLRQETCRPHWRWARRGGVALFVAGDRGLPVVGYAPARVKRTIVGHGRASKSQVAFLVRALLAMRRAPRLTRPTPWPSRSATPATGGARP